MRNSFLHLFNSYIQVKHLENLNKMFEKWNVEIVNFLLLKIFYTTTEMKKSLISLINIISFIFHLHVIDKFLYFIIISVFQLLCSFNTQKFKFYNILQLILQYAKFYYCNKTPDSNERRENSIFIVAKLLKQILIFYANSMLNV